MTDERLQMLLATVKKLYHRGATRNIQKILVKTHTADTASVLSYFPPEQRVELFRLEPSLDNRAEILSYFDKDQQVEMIQRLGKDEVNKLIPLMESDDAADLLGQLPEEESQEILSSMVLEDSEEVADLMGYPEDSAGGLMSSDFQGLNQNLSVEEAIQALQRDDEEGAVTFYVYVTNDNNKLVGVVSLKQLLLSKRHEKLKDLMQPDVISVTLDTNQEQVARVVERYDFLSIPVVNGNHELMGVITVDDVLDVIREEAKEDLLAMGQAGLGIDVSFVEHFIARIPWLLLAFVGGVFCFMIVFFFGDIRAETNEMGRLWLVAAYIPVLLSVGAMTGSQAVTVAVSAVRSGRLDLSKFTQHFVKEMQLSIVFALLFGGLVWLIGAYGFDSYQLHIPLASAMALQIFLAITIGSLIPALVYKLGIDPVVGSVPLYTAVADIAAMTVLFSLIHIASW